MATLSKCTIVGRVGYSKLDKNGSFWMISLATDRTAKDVNSESGFKKVTMWHQIHVMNSKLFAYLEKNVRVGDMMYVDGNLLYYSYEIPLSDGKTHQCRKWIVITYNVNKLSSSERRTPSGEGGESFDFAVDDSKDFDLGGDGDETPY